jgi:hypothetical protein
MSKQKEGETMDDLKLCMKLENEARKWRAQGDEKMIKKCEEAIDKLFAKLNKEKEEEDG